MVETGPGSVRPFAPPDEFDDFRVVRPLGRGGMGTVYLGHDTLLDRPVALKFVDQATTFRFLAEARALARLSHPNVVAVHRFGSVGGRPYLAYEFVAGESLDRLPLPLAPREVLRIGVGVARGLAAAHARGVIHRDVKPSNVMRSDAGEIKLIDFGVAKLLEGAPDSARRAPFAGLAPAFASEASGEVLATADASSGRSMMVGTPLYLAPEVWRGEPATPCSDVYALGVLLFVLASGHLPEAWLAGDPSVLRRAVLAGLPSLGAVADAPPNLVALVDRATRPEPSTRFASAGALRDALEAQLAIVASTSVGGVTYGLATPMAMSPPSPTPRSPAQDEFVPPPTRYASAGGVSIAYQVLGEGPIDLVLTPGFVSNVEIAWEDPDNARFLRRLARRARLITFDKRGTGLSDRIAGPATLEERVDDIRAVMDAAGSERAVIFGVSDGGAMSIVFAATCPERTRALALYGTTARSRPDVDYDVGLPESIWPWALDEVTRAWGGPAFIEMEAPTRAADEPFRRWWARYLKQSASPGDARALLDLNSRLDVRALLPWVRVPTLVMHRVGDRLMPLAGARYVAAHVPGAELVELPGEDHVPFVGPPVGEAGSVDAIELLVGTLEEFVARARTRRPPDRVLVNAIGLVPVGAPGLSGASDGSGASGVKRLQGADARAALEPIVRRELARFRGTALDARGAGGPETSVGAFAAVFDGPVRAVRCARAISHAARALGVPLRAAVHSADDDVAATGARVADVALRLACAASASTIVLSKTTRDLVAGASELSLEPLTIRAAEGPLAKLVDDAPVRQDVREDA